MKPLIAFLALASTALAAEVTPTHIIGHGDPVPRFSSHGGQVLIVPAGETVTLPADSTWDAIEVAGTLKVSRTADTVCRFTHLTVLPGGVLDMGTAADPVLKSVEFIVRDVPIDTTKDPYQFGNGIINYGTWTAYGRKLDRTWTQMEEVESAATQLTFTVPAGWKVGDKLLIPDTRQMKRESYYWAGNIDIRRESEVSITAIAGNTVTLSKPLDFEHKAVRSPDGVVRLKPYVANASRNIVIRSENPQGTRGHTINLESAMTDVRYCSLLGLGRTKAIDLDNTTADAAGNIIHVGTNQVARYAWHWHHVHGHVHDAAHAHTGHLVGCYLTGEVVSKWGVVVHGSHDMHVADNVSDGFVGSGFVTEDGDEIRNVFERNFAMNSPGNGISGRFNMPKVPGGEGAGFWFHGMRNTIRGNVAVNCDLGFQWFYRNQVLTRLVPSVPGGENDTVMDPRTVLPIEAKGNVAVSNQNTGVEYWNAPRFPLVDQVSAHNGSTQVLGGVGQGGSIYLVNPTITASGAVTRALHSSRAYTSNVEVDGGVMEGCYFGFESAVQFLHAKNLTMQNRVNIARVPKPFEGFLFENVTHKQLGTYPKIYFDVGDNYDWTPDKQFPDLSGQAADWQPHAGRSIIKNWQGTGKDYVIFELDSLRSRPAWPASNFGTYRFCPEAGLTMGQCWDKYGLAYGGGVIADGEGESLEGVINGLARPGLAYDFGPPRAVVTFPNMLSPAPLDDGRVILRLFASGAKTNDVAIVQVDDQSPTRNSLGHGPPKESYAVSTAISTGTHTVKTWRETVDGVKIPESEMTFKYYVGTPTPTDPPPDEPTVAELKARIVELLAEVAALKAKIEAAKPLLDEARAKLE